MTGLTAPVGSIRSVEVHAVHRDDPYVTARSTAVLEELRDLEQIAAHFYEGCPGISRERSGATDRSNPATAALLERYPSVQHWLDLVPSAAALDPLYAPTGSTFPNGAAIDDGTREWLNNIADAHGIRSRAEVLVEILTTGARALPDAQTWLSLACGAAQPVVEAMGRLASEALPVPAVTLVDLDRNALRLAEGYAAGRGVLGSVRTVRANVLGDERIELDGPAGGAVDPSVGPRGFDVVDAVGLLEYLKAADQTYTYRGVIRSERRLAGAVTFLRNAYALVRDGGILVVGNMLDSHPQLGFTLDVIQWPHIQPRSVPQVLSLLADAGVAGHVDVYLPSDGVYAVYVVRKP